MELEYLWLTFMRIRRRKGGGFGPEPVSWGDIDAFVRRTGCRMAPWEIAAIEVLDDLYLASVANTE